MHSPQGASTKVRFNTRAKHSFQPNTRSINANIQQHKAHVICNCVSGGSFDTHGGALLGIVILKQRVCKIGHMTNITLVPSLWNGQCHRNSFTSATTQLGRDTFFISWRTKASIPGIIICLLQALSIIHHKKLQMLSQPKIHTFQVSTYYKIAYKQ